MPWRQTKEPYFIWLSEIILQQTRVDQGMPYYLQFVEQYPDVHHLARASSQEVMKTWEGLGYYSRARNLHETAKYVSVQLNGTFPNKYAELVKLKGIGPYTAAAIASICFEEPAPVIDGNVFRFISRFFGVKKEISDQKNRKFFLEILQEVIPSENPGEFNQAVMEYGATVCKPAPECGTCVFREECFAYAHQMQSKLPVKKKKVKVTDEYIAYIIFNHEDNYLLRQRISGIWNGLYEFHAVTAAKPIDAEIVVDQLTKFEKICLTELYEPVKHLLTHKRLFVSFLNIAVQEHAVFEEITKDLGLQSYTREEILTLPIPKVISNHLERVVF